MTNKSKQKGTAAETAFVKYCRTVQDLPHVERRTLSGSKDRGDIAGLPGVVIEVKDAERQALEAWKEETLKERENDNARTCALVVKKARKSVSQWDAYIPAWMLDYGSDEFVESLVITYSTQNLWFRVSVEELFVILRMEGYIPEG